MIARTRRSLTGRRAAPESAPGAVLLPLDRSAAPWTLVPVKTEAQTTVAVPPAASIFSFAEPENAFTLTWTATERSP